MGDSVITNTTAAPQTAPACLPPPLAGPACRRVSRRWLVNALNRVNFQDGKVLVAFRNRATGSRHAAWARPSPCADFELECRWVRTPALPGGRAAWELETLQLSDGLAQIEIPVDGAAWDERGARLTLPPAAFDVTSRSAKRHECRGVRAVVTVGGAALAGRLCSSSSASFSVQLAAARAGAPAAGEPVHVTLARGAAELFSGRCAVLRSAREGRGLHVALKPLAAPAGARLPSARPRCLRPQLAPLPLIVFRHPLSGRQVALRALDVSGAGFSVEEEASRAQLLPGLLLPRVRIEVAAGFEFPCAARVVYNEPTADGGLRSGLAIEAMSLRDHTRLTALLHLGEYRNTSVCTPHVDLEELWSFFFESGFIYPEKYRHIKDQKAHFLRLYRNLYTRTPRIARHIIYQERGAIHGHVSMFRWLPATWILHHHAALTSPRHKAGLVVMEQMLRYINEFHRLFPDLMRYIACYFRPNNRFASRAFGGAARALADPRRCSLDAFAYFHLAGAGAGDAPLPAGWTLAEAAFADREALRAAYARDSGGLMIEGLALREDDLAREPALSREYARLGFRRDRRLFALRRGAACVALIAANRSDLGLNLSDLTNGLQAFVVDPAPLSPPVLLAALRSLAGPYPPGAAAVLLHPLAWADANALAYDKAYELTVLDLEHIGPYLQFMDGLVSPTRRAPAAQPEAG